MRRHPRYCLYRYNNENIDPKRRQRHAHRDRLFQRIGKNHDAGNDGPNGSGRKEGRKSPGC